MVQRATTLVLLMALLVQSLVGFQARPPHQASAECACCRPVVVEDECSCCREKPAPAKLPVRTDQPCSCPSDCPQRPRPRDVESRAVASVRAVARAAAKVAAPRTLPDARSASMACTAVRSIDAPKPRAASPPAHLLTLRTTVLVV